MENNQKIPSVSDGMRMHRRLFMLVLSCFFVLFTTFDASASLWSQKTKVTVKVKNASLQELFTQIQNSTGYRFFYNNDEVDVSQKITVDIREETVGEILSQVFVDLPYSFKELDNKLILIEWSESKMNLTRSAQQQRTVTGKVTDENGESLPGVTIVVKGTTSGTITNMDGNYQLENISPNTTLIFSFVGMVSQEIAVGDNSVINVTLQDATIGLDEVVAIGYANARKQDLSVAVSNIKVDDNFSGRPSSLGTILQGEMAGVRVVQSGDPTAGADISIRGRGNRSGDGVLYIVDGVPNAPFNTADVESITVLKDAASAAIYGAYAGSGGVIIVNTRQAEATELRVDVNAWTGYQQAWRLPDVLTAQQFNKVWKDASEAAGRTIPAAYNPLQFPYGDITRTDWLDAITRSGRMQHYDLTVQGGSEDIKALGSVSYDNTQGTLITTYSEKLTARLNVDFKLADWATLSQRMLYDFGNGKSGIGDGHTGVLFGAMAYPRYATVYEYDADGNVLPGGTIPRWALAEGFSVEADLFNPVTQLENTRENNPTNRLFSATSLNLTPISGLKLNSMFSYDLTNTRNESFTKKFTAPGRTVDENYRSIANSMLTRWNWENTASYTREFNEKHILSLLGGFTMNYLTQRYNSTDTRGYDFEYENYTIFPNATDWSFNKPGESIWEESTVSALGRVSYSFDDRYFLTGSVRRDASSKLNPDNNSDIFPAASAAWKITSEPFMAGIDNLSFLKLRASWGQVGNIRSVRRFIYAPPLAIGDWGVFLGENMNNHVFGIYQSTIPNPNLKWERTEQTNLGLDAGLFNNSLNLTFDYYYKLTKDLIETMPVPSVAGVASPPEVNIGSVENYGWEMTLAYNKRFGEFDVNMRANLGKVNNNVLNIGEREELVHGNDVNSMKPLQSTVGQPWYSYYLIDSEGLFQSQSEIDNYTWTNPENGTTSMIQPNARPGDLKYRDANNDGRINDDDRVYMGAYDYPDLSYGITLGGSWKNFSLSMFWQGVAGVEVFNGVKVMSSSGLKGWNMTTEILDSYEYNPNSGVPRLSLIDDPNGNYSLVSDYFLEKGDYLRLKNLNISYSVPATFLARLGWINPGDVRFYLNGENLLTFTPYSAFDPEVGYNGVDDGRFPVSRMYSVGLNVTF